MWLHCPEGETPMPDTHYRMAARLRYNIPQPNPGGTSTCQNLAHRAGHVCGVSCRDDYGAHAARCKHGGGVQQRHDNARDVLAKWLTEVGVPARTEQAVPAWRTSTERAVLDVAYFDGQGWSATSTWPSLPGKRAVASPRRPGSNDTNASNTAGTQGRGLSPSSSTSAALGDARPWPGCGPSNRSSRSTTSPPPSPSLSGDWPRASRARSPTPSYAARPTRDAHATRPRHNPRPPRTAPGRPHRGGPFSPSGPGLHLGTSRRGHQWLPTDTPRRPFPGVAMSSAPPTGMAPTTSRTPGPPRRRATPALVGGGREGGTRGPPLGRTLARPPPPDPRRRQGRQVLPTTPTPPPRRARRTAGRRSWSTTKGATSALWGDGANGTTRWGTYPGTSLQHGRR